MAGKMTPMMEQYINIKNRYKNCILFYRLGDFYEMFFDDALVASKLLDITLTGKDCGMEKRAPMCGVPFHSADSYIAKLVENGKKVAICEQVEDPKMAKGIVKRDVVRVITPGTLLDTNALDEGKNNYIMCIYRDLNGFGVSACDITTGDLIVTESAIDERNKVLDFIAMYKPAEIIGNYERNDFLANDISNIFNVDLAYIEDYNFNYDSCYERLTSTFNVENLDKFNIEDSKLSTISSGALVGYISENYKGKSGVIFGIRKFKADDYMVLDLSSRKNLELTQSVNDGGKRGSLLWVLDRTKTAMGARTMRNMVEQPLIDTNKINKRLDGVEELKNKAFEREELRESLGKIYDFERIISKVSYDTANAKDLNTLRCSLEVLPDIKSILSSLNSQIYKDIYNNLDTLDDFWGTLKLFIVDDPPFSVREGGMIREGMNPELDKLREARDRGDELIRDIEEREKERTGIKKLKIKYNKVFGYFIEVTNSFKDLVPDDYIRKQTLANCERYITSELKDVE
ncbi:MAG: DNA mismatch repair protein MutS, partial [Lachnospirales bacterium]